MKINELIKIDVCRRFSLAIDGLKSEKVIRGLQKFSSRYGYDRRNMQSKKNNPEYDVMKISWLVHLIEDYDVSLSWLLYGKGAFYYAENTENLRK